MSIFAARLTTLSLLFALTFVVASAQTPVATQGAEEARALNVQAVKLYREGKYQEAIAPAKRALEIWEKERGKENEQSTVLLNLAEIHRALKNYAEAETYYRRTVKMKEKLLGADSPELYPLLIKLGWMQHGAAHAVDAEENFKRAIAVKEKQRGADHLEVADALLNLALFYQKLGKPKSSLPLYERMIAIREKGPGADQRELAEAMEQSYCALNQSGKPAEAEAIQERLLKLTGGLPAGTIRASGQVLQGKAIQRAQPPYPRGALAERLAGTVYIKVVIDESGNVIDASVICGPDLLATASLEAARKWRFAPTTVNGDAVKVQGVLTFHFNIR